MAKSSAASAYVFTGTATIKTTGVKMPFPKDALKKGMAKQNKHTSPEDVAWYRKVQLFRSKQKWWLYYGPHNCTGDFRTKREAIAWFTNGGR